MLHSGHKFDLKYLWLWIFCFEFEEKLSNTSWIHREFFGSFFLKKKNKQTYESEWKVKGLHLVFT